MPKQDPDGAAAARRAAATGAWLMIGAVMCLTSLDAILKILVQRHDPWFLAWGRNAFQVLYLVALMPLLGSRRMLRTGQPLLHLARGAMLLLTTVFIILALRHLPMAQTYAITFSTPLIASVIAALALGERPSTARWAWIMVGFAGVLVALQPNAPMADVHLLYPLGMAAANALFHVLTRYGGREEDPLALLFYVAFVACLIPSLALPWIYEPMRLEDWALLGAGAALGTVAHLLVIQAFRLAPTAIVSPMVYTQILWASVLGFAVFGEIPTAATLLGAGIVGLSGIALLRTRA